MDVVRRSWWLVAQAFCLAWQNVNGCHRPIGPAPQGPRLACWRISGHEMSPMHVRTHVSYHPRFIGWRGARAGQADGMPTRQQGEIRRDASLGLPAQLARERATGEDTANSSVASTPLADP
ncbi:hypothetical protein CC78DRAFT_543358 [Lojkania enalia]|uniref:Secreted protein n=1 Tax=Lojkania enalia TaxID=147567 RepID=A0A9P4KB51_9PLEO|nr:hypothetical protein CC78DRAFT_543358 [Didymosphaeria enalia]